MARGLFEPIGEAISDTFRHLGNADPMMLVLIAGGVALVGYFLLKR